MAEFVTASLGETARVLVVSGEVDVASADDLLPAAEPCLVSGASELRVDLGAVTFIDSSGLGALVQLRNAAARHDQQVVLENVPASVRRLLEITGLTEILPTRSDG